MFSCVLGREEHCKQISLSCVGSAPSVWTHWVCHSSQQHVLYRSRLLRRQVGPAFHALPRSKPLGSQVLCQGIDSAGHVFCALPRSELLRRPGAWRAHCLSKQSVLNPSPVPTRFAGAPQEHLLKCAMCLLWGADLRLRPFWQLSAIQDPRKT